MYDDKHLMLGNYSFLPDSLLREWPNAERILQSLKECCEVDYIPHMYGHIYYDKEQPK